MTIKTWEERVVFPDNNLNVKCCMQAEIDELRAELADIKKQKCIDASHGEFIYETMYKGFILKVYKLPGSKT